MSIKRVVLIIGDEEAVTGVLTSALLKEGYKVHIAKDRLEGFEKARRETPDIILLNIMMSVIDADELLHRLCLDPQTRRIPLIFLTDGTDNDELVSGQEFGAVDYITKPFHPRELLARISIHLRLKQYEEELTRKNRELEEYSDLLLQMNARLDEMARKDELTQIGNRRAFNEQIISTHGYSRRYMRPYSIILVDLDNFKNYNDLYGHQMGDQVLKNVADCINKLCRSTDFACRYGGEEIVILLRETDLDSSQTIAERIIRAIEALNLPHEENQGHGRVTVSAGVACYYPARNPDEDWEAVLKRADDALYVAKDKGRNRAAHCH